MDPRSHFDAEAKTALTAALAAVGYEGAMPALESPPDRAMGDAGMPCFALAAALKKSPMAIAADIAEAVEFGDAQWIVEARAVGPYVNLWMDRTKAARLTLDDPAAAVSAEPIPGKVLIEHTSANPNGPLHVGRARNPILGDTLVRLHRAAGYDVDSQYYMDNLGRQVALLWWGRRNIDGSTLEPAARDKPDHDLVRYYQAANEMMENDPAIAAEIKELVAKLETADDELLQDVREVYESCFSGMAASLERLGVTYNSIKDESDLVQGGEVDGVIAGLKKSPRAAQEPDGANYLDMEAELAGNKSTKFFFTRRDQTSVYATRDVAYHKWKSDQVGSSGRLLDVLGEDHRLQSLQVGVALDELGARRPDVVFYAFVSLPEGKMSTRANRVVFVDDLLDEAVARARAAVGERRGHELADDQLDAIGEAVGIAAIRFNIARVQPEKPIKFRWEEALDFEGDSAPYLMYAHARAASLVAKAAGAGVKSDASGELGDGEAQLLNQIARLPSVARDAADSCAPQRFCAYALELASSFNEYYRDHPVVGCEDAATASLRLAVIEAAVVALRAAHEALGIPILESM